jgi:hypothetical protein
LEDLEVDDFPELAEVGADFGFRPPDWCEGVDVLNEDLLDLEGDALRIQTGIGRLPMHSFIDLKALTQPRLI